MPGDTISPEELRQIAASGANVPKGGYDPEQWKRGVAAAGSGAAAGFVTGGPVGAFVGALAGWFGSGGAGAAAPLPPAYWTQPIETADLQAQVLRLLAGAAEGYYGPLPNALAAADPAMLPALSALDPGRAKRWWQVFLSTPSAPARRALAAWVAQNPGGEGAGTLPILTAGEILVAGQEPDDARLVLLVEGASGDEHDVVPAAWAVLDFGNWVRELLALADQFVANPRPTPTATQNDASHAQVIRDACAAAADPAAVLGPRPSPIFGGNLVSLHFANGAASPLPAALRRAPDDPISRTLRALLGWIG